MVSTISLWLAPLESEAGGDWKRPWELDTQTRGEISAETKQRRCRLTLTVPCLIQRKIPFLPKSGGLLLELSLWRPPCRPHEQRKGLGWVKDDQFSSAFATLRPFHGNKVRLVPRSTASSKGQLAQGKRVARKDQTNQIHLIVSPMGN